MNKNVELSLVAEEVIRPGTEVHINIKRPFRKEVARAAIVVQQDGRTVPATIDVDERAGRVRISSKNLPAGRYDLRIHELLDNENEEILNHAVVPFRVDEMRGDVTQKYRVEHISRLAVGKTTLRRLDVGEEAPKDFEYVEFAKAVHRDSGEPREMAFNWNGEPVDGRKVLIDLQHRRHDKYGALHDTLHTRLSGSKGSDKFDVAIWPQITEDLTGYEKPNHGEIKEPPSDARRRLENAIRTRSSLVDKVNKLGGKVKDTPEEALAIHATLTADQVRKLGGEREAGRVWLDDPVAVLDLADSMAIARVPQAQAMGYKGAGVRVAVFEDGPSDLSNLQYAGRYQPSPPASNHARLTSAIIKNTEPNKPHGYAPDCMLYSANSFNNAALNWAVQSPQLCTVISQSFHRLSSEGQDEQGSPFLSADDVLKDHLATRYPYPTIVHAAGNISQAVEYVNHKGYNTISIANHDDNATAIAGDSVFRNPSSNHGDRELPEMAANGTGVSAVGQSMSGTSCSAPAVAGTAAIIQSVDSTLKSWPEGCRAILMASADRNITGGTWVEDLVRHVDQSDGSGALNAFMAASIAQQRRVRDGPAVPRGYDVGSLGNDNFNTNKMSKFRYRVQVPPSTAPGPIQFVNTVKVALAWNSKVTVNASGLAISSILTVDLDLIVQNSLGQQVAASASFDNSYEIVEFTGIVGNTYDIFIRRWSGTDIIWYGIAWNVTQRRFNVAPLIAGLE